MVLTLSNWTRLVPTTITSKFTLKFVNRKVSFNNFFISYFKMGIVYTICYEITIFTIFIFNSFIYFKTSNNIHIDVYINVNYIDKLHKKLINWTCLLTSNSFIKCPLITTERHLLWSRTGTIIVGTGARWFKFWDRSLLISKYTNTFIPHYAICNLVPFMWN